MTAIRRRCLAIAVVATAIVSACSSDGEDTVDSTIAATTTTMRPSVVTDGQLVIGVMVPTGDALIGEPIQEAVATAVDRINTAGGVLGRPVRVIPADEGDLTTSAVSAVQSLLDRGVDAIVGPASSLNALSSLDEIVASGTLACSPTASSMALDDFPDNDLFFRTIPSDSLQARAIAQAADQTGAQRAAIVYVDDAYGRPFAEAVETELQAGAMAVVESIPLASGDDSFSDEAIRLIDADAQVAIVLADADDGSRFLASLGDAGADGIATIIVNDAVRNPTTPQRIQALDPEFRSKILGLAPQAASADPTNPFDPPGLFAANAFDCVNLIALAAVKAASDAPAAIAAELANVSFGGSPCSTFVTCVETIRDEFQIDYNGPSGITELQPRTGDPARATFDRFYFDDTGTDVLRGTVVVSR